jgi:ApaG protein
MHRSISVDVETAYVQEQSDPAEGRYVFAYTVTIRNEGGTPARLLRRHWIITDGNGEENEVRGDGVVGEQPHLQPGEGFRYTSGAILKTPVGTMRGSYQLVDDEGVEFDAPIDPFLLAKPGSVN